jgi:hypothetical protein
MSGLADPPSSRHTFTGAPDVRGKTRNLPVLPSSAHHSGAMEITPPSSGPTGIGAVHSSPDGDRGINTNGPEPGITSNPPNPAVGAAAAAQQPKVVQTAFIHKLYKYAPRPLLPDTIWGSR